jgi:hypothetical protein
VATVSAGAYGLQVDRIAETAILNPAPPATWAPLTVRWEDLAKPVGTEGETGIWADESTARVQMSDGALAVLDREAGSLTWHGPRNAEDGRFAHPLFGAVGAVHAWWRGAEALHGGAFVAGAGAWALLGDPGAGKSSVLAGLAGAGTPVLADDCVVIDGGGLALAGPRCVDVRPGDTVWPSPGGDPVLVRGGARRRIGLAPVAPEVPFCGAIVLGWGDSLEIRRVPVAERLGLLAEHRWALLLPRRPEALLDLARLPVLEVRRPRGPGSFTPTLDRMLEIAAD